MNNEYFFNEEGIINDEEGERGKGKV